MTTSRSGFTLIELLIGLSLGTLILMAALSILTEFLGTQTRHQHLNNLLATSEAVFNQLSLDIHDSSGATVEFNRLILILGDKQIHYQINDSKQLTRTDLESGETDFITPPTVKVTDFSVLDKAASPPVGLPQPTVPPLLKIHLALESDSPTTAKATLEKETTISIRQFKHIAEHESE